MFAKKLKQHQLKYYKMKYIELKVPKSVNLNIKWGCGYTENINRKLRGRICIRVMAVLGTYTNANIVATVGP